MTTIAIIDDRITNRNIFSRLAYRIELGARVLAFGDPILALAAMDKDPPDLVIADYKMPGLDGAEFARELRKRAYGADLALIVVTAYADRTFRLRALQAGATEFLQTPFDHEEFVHRARLLLSARRHSRELRDRVRLLKNESDLASEPLAGSLASCPPALVQILDLLPVIVAVTDIAGRCLFVNAPFAAMSGARPADLIGRDLAKVFGSEREELHLRAEQLVLQTGRSAPAFDEAVKDGDRIIRLLRTTKEPLRSAAGEITGVLTTTVDISEHKRAERHLLELAQHDSLTDLPNRALLCDRIQKELDSGIGGIALHFLDLDRFKEVNEAFGHQVGDELLKEVAARLRQSVRGSDLVARLGGDEFAVLQTGISSLDQATQLAGRLLGAVGEEYRYHDNRFHVSVSIGVTLAPQDGTAVEELLRNADLAMYDAKYRGRNGYAVFRSDLAQEGQYAVLLEADLRRALKAREFVLYYQPLVELRSGRLVGAEALLRWRRPGWDLVAPSEFLPVAEETGLIQAIGEWVLQEACHQAEAWRRAAWGGIRVAVNLSPVQIRSAQLTSIVRKALKDSQLPPALLDLELSESMLLTDVERASSMIEELRSIGVQASIDDFGVGHLSMAYLKQIPVTRLKIDRSLLGSMSSFDAQTELVKAVINLGHHLKLTVTAEGVESPEQYEELKRLGCDEAQGFLVGPPLPASEFDALAQRGVRLG
jgi:diguanylate cyclase (GGDEF)-like protein/PAS domain S-box-containing protein